MTFIVKQLLPDTISISAIGEITADDYKKFLLPLFEKYYESGEKIRVLIEFGKDFKGYTAGAAWQDAKLGFRYMRVFERCAVVSDMNSILNLSHFFGGLIPCAIATFKNDQMADAKAWLSSGEIALDHKLDSQNGILNVEIHGPISAMNVEILADTVDSYLKSYGMLNGLVIHVKKFPGWENFGSLMRHVRFVKNHHQKIERVALVTDSLVAEVVKILVQHFIHAKIRHFKFDQLDEANEWVRGKI